MRNLKRNDKKMHRDQSVGTEWSADKKTHNHKDSRQQKKVAMTGKGGRMDG